MEFVVYSLHEKKHEYTDMIEEILYLKLKEKDIKVHRIKDLFALLEFEPTEDVIFLLPYHSPFVPVEEYTEKFTELILRDGWDLVILESFLKGLEFEAVSKDFWKFFKEKYAEQIKLLANSIKDISEERKYVESNPLIMRSILGNEIDQYEVYVEYYKIPEALEFSKLPIMLHTARGKYFIRTGLEYNLIEKSFNILKVWERIPELLAKGTLIPRTVEMEINTDDYIIPVYLNPLRQYILDTYGRNKVISAEKLASILEQLPIKVEFIILGGIFETVSHQNLEKIINVSSNFAENIILYTYLENTEFVRILKELLNTYDKLNVFVNIDSVDMETYQKIYGIYAERNVENNIKELANSSQNVFVFISRNIYNEESIVDTFNHFANIVGGDKVIVQKPLLGYLGDKSFRSVDLSPIDRFPCYKILHNAFIGLDGDINICRFSHHQANSFSELYKKKAEFVEKHLNLDFSADTGICANCDEWYIYY